MTLTKDQRRYRKDKKDGERNFRTTVREDGTRGVRVTYRKLCVRVNDSAYDRLKTEAENRGMSMGDLLTRMIYLGIQNYGGAREMGTQGYRFEPHQERPDDFKVRYKGNAGTKMLTLKVTTTAWIKLDCHHVTTGLSKARMVQDLILGWRFTPQHVMDKQKAREEENRAKYAHLNRGVVRTQRDIRGSRRWLETCSIEELDAYYAEEEAKTRLMVERAGESFSGGESLYKDKTN